MSTDIAHTADPADTERLAALLGMNPRDPKTHAMIAVCQRYDLDPLLKHVVVIPGSGPYLTRDGLLHVAHRSGQFDGMTLVSGPELVDGEWRCVVSVYRKDMSHPFTFPGRYSATGGNRKYAPEMALKVAECMALRRAFDVSGMGVLDEQQPEPEQSRPVERVTSSRDETRWDSPSPAIADAVVVEDSVGEAAAEGVSPTAHPPGYDRTTGAPIAYGPGALIDTKSSHSKRMYAQLRARVSADKAEQLAWCVERVGRPLATSAELTQGEQSRLLDALDALPPLVGAS